ncbi:MAG TPA: helix-turn-helix domain-containing protein [Actinomycetota bacterium]|nr:helix-turn-helix domain-containing protein [Actinomycetota bacterium]
MAQVEHGESPVCKHFQAAAELVAQRWTPQIVRAMDAGAGRYTELKQAVPGIPHATLSDRLKELEARGVVIREVTPSTPVRVGYRLTAQGQDLVGVFVELAAWAERWSGDPEPAPA